MTNLQAKTAKELPEEIINVIKTKGKSDLIVLVTGAFDILHSEHSLLLKKASQLGSILIVGIESDQRVREIKGSGRPINTQTKRLNNLLALEITQNVFILPNQFGNPGDHLDLIKTIRPDFLAVSSHTSHLDKKQKIMDEVGGELAIVHAHNPNVSSTKIIDKIGYVKKL